ncbi:Jag N-terminal domain-containing protein [Arcobacter sp. 15-2]|uniref:Jag N-terminal domain-containing protein n=1 Tax=Arcobacter sp. 15-2 TaxID=3374109 RepID=UPI00399D1B2C
MLKGATNEIVIFEAKTLEAVYEKASKTLQCSITNLEIEIKQAPSKGFFGFFSKNAIISAQIKNLDNTATTKSTKNTNTTVETLSSRLDTLNKESKNKKIEVPKMVQQIKSETLFDEFYTAEKTDLHETPTVKSSQSELSKEIEIEINSLFSNLCYDIDKIEVSIIDDEKTVYVEFSGADSALLIGKEGYRYKALSYILFNWINEKYGLMLRLEVAHFLANQETAIYAYLDPVIETIKSEGFFKTKVLDGILVHIALTKLRDEFPDKYVAVKTTQKGEKYILVNEYRN